MFQTCQECGACCVSNVDEHVFLTRGDMRRLGPKRAGLVVETDHEQGAMRTSMGEILFGLHPCVALARDGQGFSCSVYEDRPEPCRALERGSSACLELMARAGVRPA